MSRCHIRLQREFISDSEVRYLAEDLDNFLMGERMLLATIVINLKIDDASVIPLGYWSGNPVIASIKHANFLFLEQGREGLNQIAPYGGRWLTNLLGVISMMIESRNFQEIY